MDMFFHTDYRPLIRDANLYCIDEQVKDEEKSILVSLKNVRSNLSRPVYSCIFPPPAGGGIKSKDLEMGKEIKGWKNEKM